MDDGKSCGKRGKQPGQAGPSAGDETDDQDEKQTHGPALAVLGAQMVRSSIDAKRANCTHARSAVNRWLATSASVSMYWYGETAWALRFRGHPGLFL